MMDLWFGIYLTLLAVCAIHCLDTLRVTKRFTENGKKERLVDSIIMISAFILTVAIGVGSAIVYFK